MFKKAFILFFTISPLVLLVIVGYPIQSTTIPPQKGSKVDIILSKDCTPGMQFRTRVDCYENIKQIQGNDLVNELNTQLTYARKQYSPFFFAAIILQLILIMVILIS